MANLINIEDGMDQGPKAINSNFQALNPSFKYSNSALTMLNGVNASAANQNVSLMDFQSFALLSIWGYASGFSKADQVVFQLDGSFIDKYSTATQLLLPTGALNAQYDINLEFNMDNTGQISIKNYSASEKGQFQLFYMLHN